MGGVQTHVEHISRGLVARGHRVDVLTHSASSRHSGVVDQDGVIVRSFRSAVPSEHYDVAPGMWRWLRRYGRSFDVVHAHAYHALPALLAALTPHTALVFTPHYHGTGHTPFRSALHVPYRLLGRVLVRRSNAIICVSEPEAGLLLRDFPEAGPKLSVIPNGVDAETIGAADPFPLAERVILSAGRLERYKHVEHLIEALPHLEPAFRVKVTGVGGWEGELRAATARVGVEDRVDFLGQVEVGDLYRWFRTAEVYVSLSSNEAMPVTPLEALSAGARVVLSDIPAHRGLAAKVGGAVSIVPLGASGAVIARAIKDAAEREPSEESTVPSWNDIVDATLEVYRSSLAGAAAAA